MPIVDYSPKGPAGRAALKKLRGPDGDVVIAHMDTGFTEHPVFESVRDAIALGGDYLDADGDGYDPLPKREAATDWPGHGTRTLSVLCGRDEYVVGAVPGARVLVCRVSDSPVFDLSTERTRVLGRALTDLAENAACRVVSVSMGIPSLFPLLPMGPSEEMGLGVDACYDRGIIVVAAAGQIIDRVTYPGRYFRAVGVGGLTFKGEVWERYDDIDLPEVDVWAWGHDVHRANAVKNHDTGEIVYCYTHQPKGVDEARPHSGTSYATAQVAGAAALWIAHHGTGLATYHRDGEHWRLVEAFKQCLLGMPRKIAGQRSAALDVEALLAVPLPDADGLIKAPPAAHQRY